MKKNLLLLILILLFSCRSESGENKFNTLISAPLTGDRSFYTNQEGPVEVSYNLAPNKEHKDLELVQASEPKSGKLSNCMREKLQFKCTYNPNKYFFGEDSFVVTTKNGVTSSQETSRITIHVKDINDRPIIGPDQTESLLKDTIITFNVLPAYDSDTPAAMLDYQIVSNPTHGQLSNCLNGIALRSCTYTPNKLFTGEDSFTYRVIDGDNLESNETAKVTLKISNQVFEGEEHFPQDHESTLKGADIVWVIDNSGPMGDVQEKLAANVDYFLKNFLKDDKPLFDFNIQVTASDAYWKNLYGKGNFAIENKTGNPYDLSSSAAQSNYSKFISDFKEAIKVGVQGNGSERTLSSMDVNFSSNPTWFKGDNYLLIYIIVSDENEQSIDKSAAQWVQRFQSIKNESNKVRIYSITNPTRDKGNRYTEMAASTAAKTYDIDNNFSTILDDISLAVSDILRNFRLKTNINIINDSIKVYINGNELPRTNQSGNKNWKFESGTINVTKELLGQGPVKVTYKYTY